MAEVAAECILEEMHDKNKLTHKYLDSMDGVNSWGKVTREMHEATLGRRATNDVAEGPFAGLTQQLQAFTTLSGTNAAAVAQAMEIFIVSKVNLFASRSQRRMIRLMNVRQRMARSLIYRQKCCSRHLRLQWEKQRK